MFKIIFTLLILTSLSGGPRAVAQSNENERTSVDGCVLYGNANFTGGSFVLAPNDEFAQFEKSIDNKISSVKVGPHCILEAYDEWLWQGLTGVYKEGEYSKIEPNDSMTSARCICDYI